MKELIQKLEDKIRELKERKDKIEYRLDVIDDIIEDEKENAEIVSDMLTGEINEEELEDKWNDLDDHIHSLMDIVETLKLGKELDQMQEVVLKDLMYTYDITA